MNGGEGRWMGDSRKAGENENDYEKRERDCTVPDWVAYSPATYLSHA